MRFPTTTANSTTSSSSSDNMLPVEPIAVPITKPLGPEDSTGTPYMYYVDQNDTLATFRAVLTEDGLMGPEDIFLVEGRFIGKSSETKVKTVVAQAVSASSICIPAAAGLMIVLRQPKSWSQKHPVGSPMTY